MRTRIVILFFPVLIAVNAKATKSLSIPDALKQKLITVSATGKGGYTGDVLKVTVKSTSALSQNITLDAGLRFHPDDATQQDILVTGAQQFVLAAGQSISLDVNGMCCIASNASPSTGMNFTLLGMADTALVRVAKYIDEHKMYASPEAQDAVWVVSDKHRVESVDFMDPQNEGLVDMVTQIRGVPKPEYVIDYRKDPARPFSGDAANVKGSFRCKIRKQGELVMAIYDSQGNAFDRSVFDGPPMPGNYNFGFEFNVYNFPTGTYYARVLLDNKVLAEVKIVI